MRIIHPELRRPTPSTISFTTYSESHFREHLPDDLRSNETTLSPLEIICCMSLLDNQVSGPNYYCMQESMYQPYNEMWDMDVDWVSISKSPKTGEWRWSIEVPESHLPDFETNPIRYCGERNEFMMSRLRHDIVAYGLGESKTDVPLKDIFPDHQFSEDEGNRTPDILFEYKGVKYIIEIGTSLATDSSTLTRDYVEKVFKYDGILSEISHDMPCVFIVIVVGQFGIVSNHLLLEKMLKILTYHIRLGVTLERKLENEGLKRLVYKHDTVLDSLKTSIYEQIKSVPIQSEGLSNPLDITPKFIESLDIPADKDKVRRYFTREIEEHTLRLRSTKDLEKTEGKRIREEFINLLKTQESRIVEKPILPLPLVVIPRSKDFDAEFLPIPLGTKGFKPNPVINLWRAAVRQYNYKSTNYIAAHKARLNEMYEEDPVIQEEIQKRNKEHRNQSHRANVKGLLSESDLQLLAMDGVWAKRFTDDVAKKSKYVQTKLPWNWDVDCSDITAYLQNSSIYMPYEYIKASPVSEKTMRLIRHSLGSLHQNEDHIDDLESWFSTKIVCALSFLSDVVHEIAISAKQYVNMYEVIVKKLAFYDAYLLIIPTKPSEHIFFSIYIPGQAGLEVLSELPFRRARQTMDGGVFTDFCSFRADKLENATTILERFLASALYWSHHYGLKSFKPKDFINSHSAIVMSNFTTLITLENKHETEEVITITRYMYMEVMKSQTYVSPFPSRLISKFSTCPRSRLSLFILKRILQAFEIMSENGVRKVGKPDSEKEMIDMMDPEEEVLNADHWVGLINPYTMSCETSGSKIVMLFYLGYAISKNLVAQENSDYQTIEKAIREDRKFDPSDAKKSNGSWDNFETTPKDKQFSINVVKYGVELLRGQLKREMGSGFRDIIMDNILKRLANHMTNDLASTKASANIDHVPWHKLPSADQELSTKKGRLKVIEALVKEIGLFEHNPYLGLKEIIHIIQVTSQGLICDLFKKNQHGGIREIYVLTIKSRILALFVETCARELCSHFNQETMTHPDHKLEVVEAHKAKVAHQTKKKGKTFIEFHCSADKAKWNNNLTITVLSIPLFMLLPKSIHGCIQTILNMWTKRLVKVPTGVLKLLVSGTMLSCPTYQEMLKEFDCPGSTGKLPLFTAVKSPYAILRTGMMQGILHYTSSLLHVAFLASTKSLIKESFRALKYPVEPVIDQMCSSDDSATIISVIMDIDAPSELRNKVALYIEVLCQVLTTFCQYSSFTNSDKSTMGAPHQLEFNSEFIITNTLAVPTFKWLLASLSITEAESLFMRSISSYNLLSQVYAAGLPAYYTSILQGVQAILHYRLLGANTCAFFTTYAEQIERHPDPHLGYFIMDNIYVPGALGYSYHHWLHCRVHNIWDLRKKSVLDGTLGMTPDGGVVDQFLVHHGDSRRYHALVDRMKCGDADLDVRKEVNENFPLLYRQAMSKREAEIKLRAKALTPGTAQSLSRGVAFLQAISISVYMLFTFCFSRYESSFLHNKMERKKSKISLMGELRRRINRTNEADYLDKDLAEQASFPNNFRYKTYLSVLTPYQSAREVLVTPMRYRKSTIRFPQATSSSPVDLFTLVKERWFGHQNRFSVQNKEKSWKHYQTLMGWLTDDVTTTLEQSPFPDHLALFNFLSTLPKTTRRLSRVGPAIRASFPIAQVNQLARRTWKDGVVLQLGGEVKDEAFRQFRDRRTSFGLALEIPNDIDREVMVKHAAECHPVTREELEMVRGRHRREGVLAIIVGVMQKMDDDLIKSAIDQMGTGLFLGWTTAQVKHVTHPAVGKRTVKWDGKGELTMCNKELTCIATLLDEEVLEISINSLRALTKHYKQVLATFHEQKLKLSSRDFILDNGKPKVYSYRLTKTGVRSHGDGPGIVLSTSARPIRDPDLSNLQFSVGIARGKIVLRQKLTEDGSAHTVFSYNVLDHEFCAAQSAEITNDVWLAWYKQSRMKFEVASDLITSAADRVRLELERGSRFAKKGELARETKDIRDFLANTLKARLKHKSYDLNYLPEGTRAALEADSDQSEDDESLSDYRAEMNAVTMEKDLYASICELEGHAALMNSAEADQNELVADALEGTYTQGNFDKFYESLVSHQPAVDIVTDRLTNKYSVLPFWDEFIERIARKDSRSWGQLLSGQEPHSLDRQLSRDIIWILLNSESTPLPLLGSRSKTKEIRIEALHATYAGSVGSRLSVNSVHNPKVRMELLRYGKNRLMEVPAVKSDPLLSESILEAFDKGFDDWIESHKEIPPAQPVNVDVVEKNTGEWVEQAHKELLRLGYKGSVSQGSDEASTIFSDSEESEEPPRERDRLQVQAEETFVYTDSMRTIVNGMLSDAEVDALWMMYRRSHWSNDIADEDMLVMLQAMRHKTTRFITTIPSVDSKYVYFCHLGALSAIGGAETGHWVCFVTGSPQAMPGTVLFFDGFEYLGGSTSFDEAYEMFSVLHPEVQKTDIQRKQVAPQIGTTCGHIAALYAFHYLEGIIPPEDSNKRARQWVHDSLEKKEIIIYKN